MLWRNMDPTHPKHKEGDPRFADYIYYLYEEVDKMVGQIMPALDDDTLLLACSDHGFAQFGKQFHLNSWLRRNGYLTIKPEAANKPETSLRDIDWAKTIAYGIGFNGLYLNLKGREGEGIIEPDQAGKYVKRISNELMAAKDDDGSNPVSKVYLRDDEYTGDMVGEMAEMLVGYTPGYRNSSDSVLGATSKKIIDVNPWSWSGDHSMARDMVPGTLLSSRKVKSSNPNLIDLPVTILDYFGIERPKQMTGKSIFKS